MTGPTERRGTDSATRLATLLDKLVVVHLDIDGVCKADIQAKWPGGEKMADACKTLTSVIEDLRDIIHEIDSLGPG